MQLIFIVFRFISFAFSAVYQTSSKPEDVIPLQRYIPTPLYIPVLNGSYIVSTDYPYQAKGVDSIVQLTEDDMDRCQHSGIGVVCSSDIEFDIFSESYASSAGIRRSTLTSGVDNRACGRVSF